MLSRMDVLLRRRAEARRAQAERAAAAALRDLAAAGIDAVVVGSLARGPFRAHSDVDILVLGDPDAERCVLAERIVGRRMAEAGLPYDIIFRRDLAPDVVGEFLEGCADASDFCPPSSAA